MIYLTGQLLFFLLITAFLGFVIGWLLRGAMLPASMFKDKEFIYHTDRSEEHTSYLINAKEYLPGAPLSRPERVES